MLGKHTEADFIEGAVFEGFQRLGNDGVILPGPHIASGAHGVIGCAVLVGQMPGVGHTNHTVILPGGRGYLEGAFQRLRKRGSYREAIRPLEGGHKAHAVYAIPIIKPRNCNFFIGAAKDSGDRLFHKGIALGRPLET